MRIELLGVGGYHPSADRHTACVLLPEFGLMLDAGTAAFRVHGRAGALAGDRLDVVLTHAHLDHVVGLTYLLGLERDGRPVETVVHAAEAPLRAVREHLLAASLFPVQPVSRYAALGPVTELAGGATLRTFPLDHPGDSLGVRVDAGGKSLAYVTDTRPIGTEAVEAIRGVDLLLHEAYFGDADRELADTTGHCTAAQAAQAAAQAGAGRLLMVHANPRATAEQLAAATAEARVIRPDAEYATDGMVIEL